MAFSPSTETRWSGPGATASSAPAARSQIVGDLGPGAPAGVVDERDVVAGGLGPSTYCSRHQRSFAQDDQDARIVLETVAGVKKPVTDRGGRGPGHSADGRDDWNCSPREMK